MFEVAEYKVDFNHDRLIMPDDQNVWFIENVLAQAKTVCKIAKKGDPVLYGRGTAWCSRKDQFSYSAGRKLALARALKGGGFDKSTRSLFWEAYFKKRGKVG